ncbi:P-loop containing nucleoside triphosphate hydrolase protein [Whalleya microplaca]|nr:P-loop containing nucleoside triphosphate hydrolase protein [Whalleya microplaca]
MPLQKLAKRLAKEPSKTPAKEPAQESPGPQIPLGTRCAFKAYHETVKDGKPTKETLSDPFANLKISDDDSAYALVIHKKHKENEPIKTKLKVNSPEILRAFREVIESYIDIPSDFSSPLELESPFKMLVHYWDDLDEHRKSVTSAVTREHLDLLFEFMKHEVQPERDNALTMIQASKIAYDNAWVIYRPGDIMYKEMNEEPWLLVCKKIAYEEDNDEGPYVEVHCTYTDDNGVEIGEALHIVEMTQKRLFPAGTPVSITDLDIYPRRFAKEGESLERRLQTRGEKFLSLKDMSTVTYGGPAEWLKKPPFEFYDPNAFKFLGVWLPYSETGRVVLDRKTFGEEEIMAKTPVTKMDPEPLYCPPYTHGYSLSRKNWCRFFVDKIDDIKWNPQAWESLILPDKEKDLLRALVSKHQFSENPRDAMQQKGKGLVILLHGTPGSGKTLTAETAAEGTKKALIPTSIGELNKNGGPFSNSRPFEKELKKVLQYATIWQAVILLDEADVFLEARQEAMGTDRNSLVAVFLKELEYFGGIVFLTTNRVASFDPAMKSRIHLSLGYTPPEHDVRRQIWLQYLDAVPADDRAFDAKKVVDSLVTADLNGREISNAVNTARTMARFEGGPLRLAHLKTVLEVRRAFDESLENGG